MSQSDQDPEIADKTVRGITEIQVYSIDKKWDLKKLKNKKVTLQGLFQTGRTGGQFTEVVMVVP